MKRSVLILVSLLFLVCVTHKPTCAEPKVVTRPIYVISDLHMNVGYGGSEAWSPIEDFRWHKALDGFLKRVANESPQGVDLVIAGDFLELWQHPSMECVRPRDAECGCSAEDLSHSYRK